MLILKIIGTIGEIAFIIGLLINILPLNCLTEWLKRHKVISISFTALMLIGWITFIVNLWSK